MQYNLREAQECAFEFISPNTFWIIEDFSDPNEVQYLGGYLKDDRREGTLIFDLKEGQEPIIASKKKDMEDLAELYSELLFIKGSVLGFKNDTITSKPFPVNDFKKTYNLYTIS